MKRILLPILLFTPMLSAQQPAQSSSDHELIQQLLQRVQQLEAEVRQLRAAGGPAAPATPTTPATPAPTFAGQAPAPAPGPQDMHDMTLPGTQGIQFRGFSDIQYRASDEKGTHHTFALGQFNLFMTSKLSDKFSVLSEMVVEADPTNGMGIDLERLLFQYSANDHFNVSFGRYHTGIGFYNTAYHHSTWLQTTVDRPFLFQFEDGGGILPIHNVGVTASGSIPTGRLGLHYIAELGNGRASRSPLDEAVQNVQDENNGKSVNFGLYARPESLRGFQAGFSFYHDTLHPEQDYKLDDYNGRVRQDIYSGHVIYQSPKFEFMNEAVLIRHAPQFGRVMRIPAFYSQVSAPFGKVRPYFRYEYMNVPRGEPLFGDIGLRHGPVTGLRFDFSDFAAFKLEYNRIMRRDFNPINLLRTQLSFTF